MEHPALKQFEEKQYKKKIPHFLPGDTVRVRTRVIEGEKERIQAFEGVVIARCSGGIGESFTVRKISYGVGVERNFPLHSPRVESIRVVRRGHVRRAKLYYLRDRVGKATRIKARQKKDIDGGLDKKQTVKAQEIAIEAQAAEMAATGIQAESPETTAAE